MKVRRREAKQQEKDLKKIELKKPLEPVQKQSQNKNAKSTPKK